MDAISRVESLIHVFFLFILAHFFAKNYALILRLPPMKNAGGKNIYDTEFSEKSVVSLQLIH